jgi:hypothetical protein
MSWLLAAISLVYGQPADRPPSTVAARLRRWLAMTQRSSRRQGGP